MGQAHDRPGDRGAGAARPRGRRLGCPRPEARARLAGADAARRGRIHRQCGLAADDPLSASEARGASELVLLGARKLPAGRSACLGVQHSGHGEPHVDPVGRAGRGARAHLHRPRPTICLAATRSRDRSSSTCRGRGRLRRTTSSRSAGPAASHAGPTSPTRCAHARSLDRRREWSAVCRRSRRSSCRTSCSC